MKYEEIIVCAGVFYCLYRNRKNIKTSSTKPYIDCMDFLSDVHETNWKKSDDWLWEVTQNYDYLCYQLHYKGTLLYAVQMHKVKGYLPIKLPTKKEGFPIDWKAFDILFKETINAHMATLEIKQEIKRKDAPIVQRLQKELQEIKQKKLHN